MDRTNEAYRAFAGAPLKYAEDQDTRAAIKAKNWTYRFRPEEATVEYVVKADLASFYDYIDHDVLARELLLRTGDHATIECLLDLLLEVQGRRYGLPQLLEPSDMLSDLYASRILRTLRRKQWPSWRYNDDFRITAESFVEVKRALDDLAAAARDDGLMLNEAKTRTPSFLTYLEENHVADYVDDAEDLDPTWAIEVLNSTMTSREPAEGPTSDSPIDLHKADRAAIRDIRHALMRLADPQEPRAVAAMPKMENIIAFVPSAIQYVLRYLRAMESIDRGAVTHTIASMIKDVSLSDWQRMCLIRVIRELRLTAEEPFTDWVTAHHAHRYDPVVRAEAALALADIKMIEAQDVVRALDEEPSALATWYLAAIGRLHDHQSVSDETYAAVREDNGLHATILAQR